jgi:hypothetical protein
MQLSFSGKHSWYRRKKSWSVVVTDASNTYRGVAKHHKDLGVAIQFAATMLIEQMKSTWMPDLSTAESLIASPFVPAAIPVVGGACHAPLPNSPCTVAFSLNNIDRWRDYPGELSIQVYAFLNQNRGKRCQD